MLLGIGQALLHNAINRHLLFRMETALVIRLQFASYLLPAFI